MADYLQSGYTANVFQVARTGGDASQLMRAHKDPVPLDQAARNRGNVWLGAGSWGLAR